MTKNKIFNLFKNLISIQSHIYFLISDLRMSPMMN